MGPSPELRDDRRVPSLAQLEFHAAMYRSTIRLSRRAAFAFVLSGATLSAAGAATFHRFAAVTQGTGSEGATNFLQSSTTSSALQGNVGSADTGIKIPFGVLGVVDEPNNAPFGIGVLGISTSGYAVAAESLASSPSILALPGGGGDGVDTYSFTGTPSALYSEARGGGDGGIFLADSSGAGLNADSQDGIGILGGAYNGGNAGIYGFQDSSSFADGIYGTSRNGDAIHGDLSTTGGHAGVVGTNEGVGSGVYGSSIAGLGTVGDEYASASPAPSSDPSTYSGIYGDSSNGPGVYGIDYHNTGNTVGYGVSTGGRADFFAGLYGYGNDGPGLYAYSSSDFGAVVSNGGNFPVLEINNNYSGSGIDPDLIVGQRGGVESGTIVFTVGGDGSIFTSGNLTYSGSLTHDAVTRSAANDVATYSAQQAEATVEDVGSAQLVNGSAAVPIAADFRDTIDTAHPYMVFLTPYGDTNGLYVASRTAAGFVVRETHGGRSSLAFDYRIVAHPYGKPLARLPHIDRRAFMARPGYTGTHRPAAFNGAARDTMALSRADGPKMRAVLAQRQKAMLATVKRHRAALGASVPAGLFKLSSAHN